MLALALPLIGRARRQRRRGAAGRDPPLHTALLDPQHRCPDVRVRSARTLDELREQRIVELQPPLVFDLRCRHESVRLNSRGLGPARRRLRLRRLEVGSDCTGAQECCDAQHERSQPETSVCGFHTSR